LVLYAVRSLRHFAPTFRAGRMLLFIHWRRRRRAPTAHGRSADRPARASCWPTSRILFRDKAGARAIGPHAADVGWRRRDASYGVIDIGPVDTAWAEGLFTSCSRIDISGWRDHGLYPLVRAPGCAGRIDRESMTPGGGHFGLAKIASGRPARAADFL